MRPCSKPLEGANNESSPTPRLSESSFSGHRRTWLRAGTAIALTSLGLTSSCNSPNHLEPIKIDPIVRQNLSGSCEIALQGIEEVESRLLAIDSFNQKYALIVAPFLLMSDTLNEGHQKAMAHFQSMRDEATAKKLFLACSTQDSTEVQQCYEWGCKTSESLGKILALLEHVASKGTMPADWEAPAGFEYIVEYRNKVFAGK